MYKTSKEVAVVVRSLPCPLLFGSISLTQGKGKGLPIVLSELPLMWGLDLVSNSIPNSNSQSVQDAVNAVMCLTGGDVHRSSPRASLHFTSRTAGSGKRRTLHFSVIVCKRSGAVMPYLDLRTFSVCSIVDPWSNTARAARHRSARGASFMLASFGV